MMSNQQYSFSASPFAERFSLLLESDQLQLPVLNVVLKLIEEVEKDLALELTEDNAEMFVTHLAMALQRIADGKPVKEAPPALLNEARGLTEYWQQAGNLTQLAGDALGQEIEENERGYLTLHLAKLALDARS